MNFIEEKKYNFVESEAKWANYWDEQDIFNYNPQNQNPIFSVDTPPPYASAEHLHVGHAMSYTQAEIIVRQRRMAGLKVFYPMGFDDNGLPTERYVEKKYKLNKSSMPRPEFVQLCLKETKAVTETYRRFWRMLGLSVDKTLEYSTIHPRAVRVAQSSFVDLFRKGLAIRKEEPVMWDTSMTTSLSQADLDVAEKKGVLFYLPFLDSAGRPLVIATTRPELLPACVGLFFNPEDERYRYLTGQEAKVPLFGFTVPILADVSVDPHYGTGLMMVCTFGDTEDIYKWRRYKLQTRVVLNENGTLNDLAGAFAGLHSSKARKEIGQALKDKSLLFKEENVNQRVTIADRSKTPIEFILKKQWFVSLVDHKARFLELGEKLGWHPEFFKVRYDDWVQGLTWDWCISRQRYYGVPVPVWYCVNCDEPIIAEIDELPVDPTSKSPRQSKCPNCGSNQITPDPDVFDTWMTSSLTPLINADGELNKDGTWRFNRTGVYPMSIRVQGFEIIRTWLFYTVAKSHFHTNSLPWTDAMISGWGLDPGGKKISKSLGNYQDPSEIVRKYSADALRYWAASGTLGRDLRYNEGEVRNGSRLVTKLFNSSKFVAMNLGKDYKITSMEGQGWLPIDSWILSELNLVIRESSEHFSKYNYATALQAIERFFWQVFCDNYLEMIKVRVRPANSDYQAVTTGNYSAGEIEIGKRVLFEIQLTLIKLFAPFLPFITEHIYQGFFKEASGDLALSVHVCNWPKPYELREVPVSTATATIEVVLSEIRRVRGEQGLGAGARLKYVSVTGPKAVVDLSRDFTREIASAMRADEMRFTIGEELRVSMEISGDSAAKS